MAPVRVGRYAKNIAPNVYQVQYVTGYLQPLQSRRPTYVIRPSALLYTLSPLFSQGTSKYVVKAQVLAGGRGKGHFDNGFQGGVHIVDRYVEVVCACK